MTEVICNTDMSYDGTARYKGEIFHLIGARNDATLVRVNHVTPITAEFPVSRIEDDSGRVFTSENAREVYRRTVGNSETTINVRKPGRPKGSRDKQPRQTART